MAGPAIAELGITSSKEVFDLSKATILQLPELVEQLPSSEKEVFLKIFYTKYTEAPLGYSSLEAKQHVADRFRVSTNEVERRKALRVRNRVLGEETLFNPLRAKRPIQRSGGNQIKTLLEENPQENCDLCDPDNKTPEDPFGRVNGLYCTSVANAGNWDAWHAMIVPPGVHNPMDISRDVLVDMIHTGNDWLRKTNTLNPKARYPFMCINHFPRAGASQFHPHLQVLLAEDEPFIQTEELRKKTADYQYSNSYPFLDELAYCLKPLGLVKEVGSARIIFNIAPEKEKAMIIYTNDKGGLPNGDLANSIYMVKKWWKESLGVTSFDLVIYLPPLDENIDGGQWCNFFPFARLVDRGSENDKTSDMGSMEIYGSSVVSSDPFVLSRSFDEFYRFGFPKS